MADFDYDSPAERADEPPVFRPHVPPVRVRLTGRDLDVMRALDVIRLVFAVSEVSHVYPRRDDTVSVYLTVSRDFPYSGGSK